MLVYYWFDGQTRPKLVEVLVSGSDDFSPYNNVSSIAIPYQEWACILRNWHRFKQLITYHVMVQYNSQGLKTSLWKVKMPV
ncbi:hypothetical protein ALC53_11576 [Atta colombica]|uniref:Uncharacterized protein n=1 Tax=Atta colombica TaxID=520822 RepID=A0A195B0V2_9HYME|nr:hypothetical protein ALC53_11576 [Atta colombica]